MWCSTVGGIVVLTLSLLAAPLATGAQQAGIVARVGYLVSSPITPGGAPNLEAFRQGLRELGWVEGQTLVIETRSRAVEDSTSASLTSSPS